jgi:hypothetical protein
MHTILRQMGILAVNDSIGSMHRRIDGMLGDVDVVALREMRK